MKLKAIMAILFLAFVVTGCGNKTETTSTEGKGTETGKGEESKGSTTTASAGGVQNLINETAENKDVRNDFLAGIKKELEHLKLPTKFTVDDLKEKDGFAFFLVTLQNPDGTPYKTSNPGTEGSQVGGLLQAAASQVVCLSSSAFATDVFYFCDWKKYKAPKEIFPNGAGSDAACADY